MAQMAKEIMEEYKKRGEPGAFISDEELRKKTPGGEPTTTERAEMRRRCKPQGPVGYLLETAHLQASSIDDSFTIKQWNQPNVDILRTPYQHLRPLIRQAAARNRTIAAEGTRRENEHLKEIDTFASKADEKSSPMKS